MLSLSHPTNLTLYALFVLAVIYALLVTQGLHHLPIIDICVSCRKF
jgi:hypothetical protein